MYWELNPTVVLFIEPTEEPFLVASVKSSMSIVFMAALLASLEAMGFAFSS